jgi:hypothetical protein
MLKIFPLLTCLFLILEISGMGIVILWLIRRQHYRQEENSAPSPYSVISNAGKAFTH